MFWLPGPYAVFCTRTQPSLLLFFKLNPTSTTGQVPPFMCCNPSFGISACICYHKETHGGLLLGMQGCNHEQCDR